MRSDSVVVAVSSPNVASKCDGVADFDQLNSPMRYLDKDSVYAWSPIKSE
jgi:hypothetical protein